MERRFSTRDLGLSLRMAVALGGIGLIYLALFAVAGWFFVDAARGGDARGFLVGPAIVGLSLYSLRQQYRGAADAVLRALRAGPNERTDQLKDIAARLAAQADLSPPDVLLADSADANSLAVPTQRIPLIIVTRGLLDHLEPQEVEAVLAHEVAHLANGDGKVMVFAGGPALALSAMWHDDLRSKFWAVLFSPVWLFGLLLMRAVSRYREYAADRGSAMLTGAPEQLMSALVKLHGLTPTGDLRGAATSALCIRSFTRARSTLLRDHPPLEKRLARLAEMARVLGTPVGS